MNTQTAYLALGANIGESVANIHEAIKQIDAHKACKLIAASSIYVTKPIGVLNQPDFVNAVIRVETTLKPTEMLELCHQIEHYFGRERTIRWGPRVIDIDILLYDSISLNEERLTLPHHRMMERAFVLVPLAEIAPDLELPGGVTAREAVERIDQSGVELSEKSPK